MYDTGTLIIAGIVILLIALVLTIAVVFIYSGLFQSIDVTAGSPPIRAVTVAYKFVKGPYSNSGSYFTDAVKLAPSYRCIGVYYDDPKLVHADNLRFIVGTILAEDSESVDESIKQTYISEGYGIIRLPGISHAVRCVFPYRTFLSVFIAIARVYPKLAQYVTEHNLCVHPFIEIYDSENIHFMGPLSRQEEFNVKEILPKAATDGSGQSESATVAADSSTATTSSSTAMTSSSTCSTSVTSGDDKSLETAEVECVQKEGNDGDSGNKSNGSNSSFEEVVDVESF